MRSIVKLFFKHGHLRWDVYFIIFLNHDNSLILCLFIWPGYHCCSLHLADHPHNLIFHRNGLALVLSMPCTSCFTACQQEKEKNIDDMIAHIPILWWKLGKVKKKHHKGARPRSKPHKYPRYKSGSY